MTSPRGKSVVHSTPTIGGGMADFLERLPFPASATDVNNRFLAINTAHTRTYGWAPDRLVGQSPRLLRADEISETFLRELSTATVRGGWHGCLPNRTRRGRTFEVLLHTRHIHTADGQVLLLGVACRPGQEAGLTHCLLELAWKGALPAAPAGSDPAAVESFRRVEALTPREHETFRLLGQGLRTAEIAFHLGISFNTARVFIAAVRVKLGCSNIETLCALAARRPH